jgi:hypothetical protein
MNTLKKVKSLGYPTIAPILWGSFSLKNLRYNPYFCLKIIKQVYLKTYLLQCLKFCLV